MTVPAQPHGKPTRLSRQSTWIRHAEAVRILREVLPLLEAERIPVLPVKGIVTAHTLYADVADRPMADIDLRLRRPDFARALDVARSAGWETIDHTPRLWDGRFHVEGWEVEVECTIGPPGLCATSIDELMGRARTCEAPLGFPHLEPEVNDHALVLCANAFKDLLRPTPWALEDLRRITTTAAFAPALLAVRALGGRMGTATWIVADWLARKHSLDPWREVRDRIGREPPRPMLASSFARFVRLSEPSPRAALLLTASAGDGIPHAVRGLTLGAFGAARGAILRRLR